MPLELGPRSRAGGRRPSVPPRAHERERLGDPAHWPRDSDSSPVKLEPAVLEGEEPEIRRTRVPALPQSIGVGLRRPRRPSAVHDRVIDSARRPRRRAHGRRRSTRCRRSGPNERRSSPPRHRADSSARADRLVTRDREVTIHPGSGLNLIDRAPADDDAVALALEQLGRARRLVLARHEQRQRAAALGRVVVELEVRDVDPLGAEAPG